MKKFIVPVILLIGAGGAYATTVAKKAEKAIVPGYRLVSLGGDQVICLDADKQCSTSGGPVCTWSGDGVTPLREFDTPTMCGEDELHEVLP